MTEFITKEEAEALIEVAYKAAFEDVYNTGAGAIALQNAINLAIAQKFEQIGIATLYDDDFGMIYNEAAERLITDCTPLYALKGDSK
jgi:hypothetical protein